MNDYISRKAVLEALVTWGAKYEAPNTRELADAIEALPKAPVLTPDEARNIAEMVEVTFYQYVVDMFQIGEMDNLGWAESILSGWRKLERMAKDD